MSRREHHLGKLAVLLVAILVVGYAAARRSRPPENPLTPAWIATEQAEPVRSDVIEQPRAAEASPALVQAENPSFAARSTLSEPEDSILLEVVLREAKTLRPIPDCEVRYFDGLFQPPPMKPAQPIDLDLLLKSGKAGRSDGQGRASLRCSPGWIRVVVASDTHWGDQSCHSSRQGESVWEVVCHPAKFVTVQVVDPSGKGVEGAKLHLYSWPDGSMRARTRGPEGIARMGALGADSFYRYVELEGYFPERHLVTVVLDDERDDVVYHYSGGSLVPRAEEQQNVELPAEVSTLPPDTVRIVMPGHGTMHVQLLDPQGQRILCPSTLIVGERGTPIASWTTRVAVQHGQATLHSVLGLDFDFRVEIGGTAVVFDGERRGPRFAGESVPWRLSAPFHPIWLVGRLRPRGPGQAISADNLESEVQLEGVPKPLLGFASFDHGVVHVALNHRASGSAKGVLFLCTPSHMYLPNRGLGAVVPFNARCGGNDIGEIELEPSALLASGTVIDAMGEPFPGVVVQVVRDEEKGATSIAWAGDAPCDESGRFELRGWSIGPDVVIRAVSPAGTTASTRVTKGTADAVLLAHDSK